ADIPGQSIQRGPADQICLCIRTGDPSSASAGEVSRDLIILSDFEEANATENRSWEFLPCIVSGKAFSRHHRSKVGRLRRERALAETPCIVMAEDAFSGSFDSVKMTSGSGPRHRMGFWLREYFGAFPHAHRRGRLCYNITDDEA